MQYMHNFLWSIVIPLGSHSTHQTIVALGTFESIVHFAILVEGELAYLSTCLENPINHLHSKMDKKSVGAPDQYECRTTRGHAERLHKWIGISMELQEAITANDSRARMTYGIVASPHNMNLSSLIGVKLACPHGSVDLALHIVQEFYCGCRLSSEVKQDFYLYQMPPCQASIIIKSRDD